MNPRGSGYRRGQPLVALTVILAGWVGVRAAVLTSDHSIAEAKAVPFAAPAGLPVPEPVPVASAAARHAPLSHASSPTISSPREGVFGGRVAPVLPAPLPRAKPYVPAPVLGLPAPIPVTPAETTEPAAPTARIAAGHQLLYLAALAQLPMPVLLQRAGTPETAPKSAPPRAARWSGDAWLLLRDGSKGFTLPSGIPSAAYGASQAGAVLRYRLAPSSPRRPELYLRATTALHRPRGEELAAGFALRPLPGMPVAALVEGRATRTVSGTVVRPAAALVTELPPAALPLGLRGEAYAQAGYVGGRDATAFADGQGRIEKRIISAGGWQLRAGAGAWGGLQKGARRIDVGPTATLDLPLGSAGGRLAADWRFRIGGNAAPSSGPAITLSAGF